MTFPYSIPICWAYDEMEKIIIQDIKRIFGISLRFSALEKLGILITRL
jgi:hypothetical protein